MLEKTRKPKGQSRMDNREKLAIPSTQDEDRQNKNVMFLMRHHNTTYIYNEVR